MNQLPALRFKTSLQMFLFSSPPSLREGLVFQHREQSSIEGEAIEDYLSSLAQNLEFELNTLSRSLCLPQNYEDQIHVFDFCYSNDFHQIVMKKFKECGRNLIPAINTSIHSIVIREVLSFKNFVISVSIKQLSFKSKFKLNLCGTKIKTHLIIGCHFDRTISCL